MLICGILDKISPLTRLKDEEGATLLSYFFCQATDSRINNAVAVLRGLIYLLIDQQPVLFSHVRQNGKYELEQRVQEEAGGANEDQKGASRPTVQYNRDIFVGISQIFRDRD
jgi:hypothetical protein